MLAAFDKHLGTQRALGMAGTKRTWSTTQLRCQRRQAGDADVQGKSRHRGPNLVGGTEELPEEQHQDGACVVRVR